MSDPITLIRDHLAELEAAVMEENAVLPTPPDTLADRSVIALFSPATSPPKLV